MTDLTKEPSKAERVEKLTQALLFALVSGVPDQPYPIPVGAAQMMADLLDDLGVRQTDQRAQEITLPTWITQRVRESTADAPTEPDPHEVRETRLIRKAPPQPARIPKKLLGVVK